jgi:hypothetical protein
MSVPLQPQVNFLSVAPVSESNPDEPKAMPRRKQPPKPVVEQAAAKRAWTLATSVFSTYKNETAKLARRCFEVDWGYCKLERVIKDDSELFRVGGRMGLHALTNVCGCL